MREIYIYRNWITDDKETMNDKVFHTLCENIKDIAVVEGRMDYEWDNVETEQASVKSIFDYMRNGYIFLDHCGKE